MAVRPVIWSTLDAAAREDLLARPGVSADSETRRVVGEILERVRRDGDAALAELGARFDGVELEQVTVSDTELRAAQNAVPRNALAAIDRAIANVRCFHEAQLPHPIDVQTMPGVRCERLAHPIDAVGLYVPAGTAPLPSAAIMLAVPATIAGCPARVLCTPPRPDGSADPAVLCAAARAGVTGIFKVGGAQAIAAMAFGTASVPAVDKIFGPGNAFVTTAKTMVSADPDGASIDMPAGPSEVLVIADDTAHPDFVAADLLAQAEHGRDSQVVLLTDSPALAEQVIREIREQLQRLTRRDIVAAALEHARIIVVDELATAINISNRYAPEHLILECGGARGLLPSIRNAGSVFIGPWTPESVGDYCSGTNHVLPTHGHARSYSGLGVDQFLRHMTVQELTRDGLSGLRETVEVLAGLEGLDAHAAAVTIRLEGRR